MKAVTSEGSADALGLDLPHCNEYSVAGFAVLRFRSAAGSTGRGEAASALGGAAPSGVGAGAGSVWGALHLGYLLPTLSAAEKAPGTKTGPTQNCASPQFLAARLFQ